MASESERKDAEMERFMLWSIRTGDAEGVRRALEGDRGSGRASPNAMDEEGAPALCWAARAGAKECAALLLEAGADVSLRDADGLTPLMLAARIGALGLECARRLLEAGARADEKDPGGVTALMLAARNGGTETAKLLLEAGADPEARGGAGGALGGWSALDEAARGGHWEAARVLLEAGADPNARSASGNTAGDFAAASRALGSLRVLEALREFGWDFAAKGKDGKTAEDAARSMGGGAGEALLRSWREAEELGEAAVESERRAGKPRGM